MDELKIREDGIYLNNQKLKCVQVIKTKSTAESNHATIYLKLLAKLVWDEGGEKMRPKRYPYSGKRKKPIEVSIDLPKRISILESQVISLATRV